MGRLPTTASVKSISIKKPKVDYPKFLALQLEDHKDIPIPIFEHTFHPTRKWRFDLAFMDAKLAVEVEGGIWNYGRHNRASSFIKDMEKYNNACLLGWNLLRLSTDMVKSGEGVIYVLKFFKGDKYIE
jgi:hypothetical protein